jgi:hypothetical protein
MFSIFVVEQVSQARHQERQTGNLANRKFKTAGEPVEELPLSAWGLREISWK